MGVGGVASHWIFMVFSFSLGTEQQRYQTKEVCATVFRDPKPSDTDRHWLGIRTYSGRSHVGPVFRER